MTLTYQQRHSGPYHLIFRKCIGLPPYALLRRNSLPYGYRHSELWLTRGMLGEPVCEPHPRFAASPTVFLLTLLICPAQSTLQPEKHAPWCHFSHAQTSKEFRPASQRASPARLSSYPSVTSSISR